jgi:high-affinity nickel-transport protein
LTPAEWRRAAALTAVVVLLHVVGFGLLLGTGALLGIGVGITAYTLGLRHAFDADHIGAIDNTTRKLMSEGQRPLSVGFFFSLGHSTIVFGLAVLLAVGIKGLTDDGSTVREATGVVGPVVSGTFLLTIGLLNLQILARLLRVVRAGELEQAAEMQNGGVMTRVYARATRAISKPWQMYPLGCLFGLGFDTATEIALLAAAATAAAGGLPWYAIMCLPILFAAGMSLLDTLDGAFMSFAYGWAFAQPVRRAFYNLTITGLSVAVALGIGALELLSAGGVSDVDLNVAGYAIAALFVLTWTAALAVWRFARIEERWTASRETA